jgi:ribosomal protein L21
MGGVVRKRLAMGEALSFSDQTCYSASNKQMAFSSSASGSDGPAVSTFAVVDHSKAYEKSIQGRHGQQLALARLEGIGKDDLPFDPFEEEERKFLEEEERKELLEAANADGEGNESESSSDDDSDEEEEDEDYDDEEMEDETSIYNNDGSVRRKKSILATLKAGYPSGGLFAVLELAGSQHKVTTDDLLVVNKLKPVEEFKVGSVHTLKDVLLAGSSHLTLVGMPHVTGAEVDVMVEEITQDAKVIIFKKRRRKHSQRKKGYRRDLTLLRILDIRLPEEYKMHDHVGRDSIDDLETVDLDNSGQGQDEISHFDEGKKLSSSQ